MAFLTSILLFKLVLALVTMSIPVVAAMVVYFDHKAEKENVARQQRIWNNQPL
jgi:hypothetical protein